MSEVNHLDEMKKEFANELFSEGIFKVLVESKIILEVPVLLLKSGCLISENKNFLEDVVFGYQEYDNKSVVFENKQGQYPVLVCSLQEPLKAVVPGVKLPQRFEDDINENLKKVKSEDLKESGFSLEAWNNYLDATPDNKNKVESTITALREKSNNSQTEAPKMK